MLFLKDFFLWALISGHVVGAAFLFRRIFPGDSRWLAFLVPEIVVVLVCNFVEHHVALTALRFMLPVTTVGAVVLMLAPKAPWRTMRLPAGLFVAAFAFTFLVRMMRPDIEDNRDGIYDLGLIANFMFGQTLPVEATWLPPVKLLYYYCLEHYAASILIRLLGVDITTGLNLCVALISAYILFVAGAVAWHLSRGKRWVALLVPVLTACAATGASGYLWLTLKNLVPLNLMDLNLLLGDSRVSDNLLLRHLTPIYEKQARELYPLGIDGWTGNFHSTNTGQLIIGLVVLSLVELLRRKKANAPWICLAISPFLMLTTCTWGLPMIGCVLVAAAIFCFRLNIVPANRTLVLAASAGLIVLLEPMLVYFLNSSSPALEWTVPAQHTPWPEFLAQWWPIFLPWLALLPAWRRLPLATRTMLVLIPLAFATVEMVNLGWRIDMTSKCWALIYAAAWIVFLPEIARQRAWPYRIVLALILINCALSLGFWTTYYARTINRAEIGHLEGLGDFRLDRRKARIVETLSRFNNQIVIPGWPDGELTASAFLIEVTHNRAFVTWTVISDWVFYTNGIDDASRRATYVDALYQGTMANPVLFLRQRNIAAVVIYPDDNTDSAVVEKLKHDLAPYYTYEDANYRSADDLQRDLSTVRPCAGVFIFHPEIEAFLGPAKAGPASPP